MLGRHLYMGPPSRDYVVWYIAAKVRLVYHLSHDVCNSKARSKCTSCVQGSLWTNYTAYVKLMDRVSLTYGSPRQHVWTFATGLQEIYKFGSV